MLSGCSYWCELASTQVEGHKGRAPLRLIVGSRSDFEVYLTERWKEVWGHEVAASEGSDLDSRRKIDEKQMED